MVGKYDIIIRRALVSFELSIPLTIHKIIVVKNTACLLLFIVPSVDGR